MTRRPRDPKWAALRQWHREQMADRKALGDEFAADGDMDSWRRCSGAERAHERALGEMTRLSRQHGRKETRG